MNNKKQRNPYFDILRGVAIIFVVGIHTFPTNAGTFEMAVRQLIQCAVPLFIAISGYFIGKKKLSTGTKYFSFLKKQLPRVYIPMLVWSLPWIFLGVRGGSSPIATILFSLIGGMCVFYFVPLIMQYYALTPLVQWAVRKHAVSGGAVSLLLMLAGVGTFVYIQHILCLNLPLALICSPFPVWCLFYYIGVVAAYGKMPAVNPWWWVAGYFLSIPVCFLEISYLQPFGHTVWGLKFSGHLISFFAVMFVFSPSVIKSLNVPSMNKTLSILAYTGRISFVIYLTHILNLMVIGRIIGTNNCWALRCFATILLTILMAKIIQMIIPLRYQRYLGF